MKTVSRREFIRLGATMGGLTAIALGARNTIPSIFLETRTLAADQAIDLSMEEVLAEMVDLTQVYMWAFKDAVSGPRIPGPVILAEQGSQVTVNLTNNLREDHAFTIPGVITSEVLSPGQKASLTFAAPAAGTYLYFDPLQAPINRVLGLHGAMVVSPTSGNTPYSSPTAPVQQLFNDLGVSQQFPGHPWDPARSFIWLFHSIDPVLNGLVQTNQTPSPEEFVRRFLPRYFTINGKTGFFSSHDLDIAPHGHVGEPALIRVLNAGLAAHSPHIHGNHVYVLSDNGSVLDNVFLVDTWAMRPLDRKDVLLPFIKPPDIPDAAWPPAEEQFPLVYPMHCHMEMSQTAAGGNYPQGLITDWVIEGPLA